MSRELRRDAEVHAWAVKAKLYLSNGRVLERELGIHEEPPATVAVQLDTDREPRILELTGDTYNGAIVYREVPLAEPEA